MVETLYTNESISFWELINKYKVEIPIIQRDYAQGREENESISKNFLSALKNSLISQKSINLDFIYGDIISEDTFQPLLLISDYQMTYI